MLSVVNELKAKIASLESMIAAASGVVDGVTAATKKRGRPSKAALATAPKVEKPKKEMSTGMKDWHTWCARLDTLLKHNEVSFKRVAEAKQFASKLKKEKAVVEWTDEEILVARAEWADAHAPVCPVCEKDATENPPDHRDCVRSFVDEFMKAGKGDSTKGITEWTKLSGITEYSEPETEKKKAGRPKMTDEQKAAAKVARDAKKADTVTVIEKTPVKPSKLGPAPGAPKKPTIAWSEETSMKLLGELESVASAE